MDDRKELSNEEVEKIIKKKRKKRKWRFSEKMVLIILIYCISIFERALYFAFKNFSESVWVYLLPIIGTLVTSAFAVFIWKEKNENLPKIQANPYYDEEQLINEIKDEVVQEYKNIGRNY